MTASYTAHYCLVATPEFFSFNAQALQFVSYLLQCSMRAAVIVLATVNQ